MHVNSDIFEPINFVEYIILGWLKLMTYYFMSNIIWVVSECDLRGLDLISHHIIYCTFIYFSFSSSEKHKIIIHIVYVVG